MGDFLGAVTPYHRELLEEQEQLGADVPVDAVSVADIVQPVEPTGTALPASSDEPKLDFLGTALNSPVPFAYGRHLVAGAPIFEHKLPTTGQTVLVQRGDVAESPVAVARQLPGKCGNVLGTLCRARQKDDTEPRIQSRRPVWHSAEAEHVILVGFVSEQLFTNAVQLV